MKKLDNEQIKAKVQAYFEKSTNDEIHVTADGMLFVQKRHAESHNVGTGLPVKTFLRDEFFKPKKGKKEVSIDSDQSQEEVATEEVAAEEVAEEVTAEEVVEEVASEEVASEEVVTEEVAEEVATEEVTAEEVAPETVPIDTGAAPEVKNPNDGLKSATYNKPKPKSVKK